MVVTDFCSHWRGLADSNEQYALRFESRYMKEMGNALNYLFRIAVTRATQEALKYTVLSSKSHRRNARYTGSAQVHRALQ